MAKNICFTTVCLILSLLALSCGGNNSSSGNDGSGQAAIQFTAPTSSPVIESFGPNPAVNFTVSAASGSAITWSLQNGNGQAKPQGTLTASGSSATYTPPPAQPGLTSAQCSASAVAPYPPLQMTVTASDSTGDSATMAITILQTPPCVATTASITAGICPPNATAQPCPPYPPAGSGDCTIGSSGCACPAAGSLMPPQSSNGNLLPQPFQVGVYGALQIYEGGGSGFVAPFGQPPFTWSVSSGSLPSGLSLQPGTTTANVFISGTPVAAGCSNFTLQITDSLGATAQLPYFVAVVPATLKVQGPNNFNGQGGVSYPPTPLIASGGQPPYSWIPNPFASYCTSGEAVDSYDLPPGLSLNAPQNWYAVISGVPAAEDWNNIIGNCSSYNLSLQVSDSQSPYPALGKSPLASINGNFQGNGPSFCTPEGNAVLPGGVSLGANAFLNGTYAFLLRGFNGNGPVAIAGSIQMDGQGNIVGGEEDVTRSSGSQSLTIKPTAAGSQSSYTVGGLANNGCMVLTDSTGTTSTYAFTLASCSNNFTTSTGEIQSFALGCGVNTSGSSPAPGGYYTTGHVVEFDSSGSHLSGILRMQTTSSFSGGLSGMYAFGLGGWDAASGHYAVAGSMQASAGALSSAAADIDDAGTLASALTGGSGTVGSVDAMYGRGAATLTLGQATYDLALYVVDAHEAIVVTTDQLSPAQPILSGEAIGTTGPFGAASLQNSHMFQISGVAGSGPDVSIGTLNFDGINSVTGNVYEDQAGTLGNAAISGGYSVDPNTGRLAFLEGQNQTLGAHAFVGYVIPPANGTTAATCAKPASCVTGFLVGTDSTAQDGTLEFQTSGITPPPPFYNAFVLGDFAFGAQESLNQSSTSSEGFIEAAPSPSSSNNSGTLTRGSRDTSFGDCWLGVCRNLIPDEQLGSGSYTIKTDGSGTFGGETVSVTNGRVIFYLDESPLNLYPSVVVADQ